MRQMWLKLKYEFRCEKGSKKKFVINKVLDRIKREKKRTTMRDHKFKINEHYKIVQGSRFDQIKTGVEVYITKIRTISLNDILNGFPEKMARKIVIIDLGLSKEELDMIENTMEFDLLKCFVYGLFAMNPYREKVSRKTGEKYGIPFNEFINKDIYLHDFIVTKGRVKNEK